MLRFPFVELLAQDRARLHRSAREAWTIYDVVIEGREAAPRPRRVPLGDLRADGRVFVSGDERRQMYPFYGRPREPARRDLELDTLLDQLACAGWMQWMIQPAGSEGPR